MTQTVPEEGHTSDLLDKEFKITVLNILKKLKENMEKELQKIRTIIYEQNQSISKNIENYKMEQNKFWS